MEILGYICLLCMGLTLGLIGAGGSILVIPILVYLFQVPILTATTYSLVIVGSSAFLGVISYRGTILFSKTLLFTIPSVVGVFFTRSYIVPNLPESFGGFSIEHILISLLLIFMSLAGYFMVKDSVLNAQNMEIISTTNRIKVILLGLSLGIVIRLLGVGGGFLILPTITLLMGIKMREAVPTSLFIITINSLVGFLSDKYHLHKTDWVYLSKCLTLAFIGTFIGIYLGKLVRSSNLKKGFGWFVCIIAVIILIREFL